MRKVNRHHQIILDNSAACGLDLNGLREKHGLPFIIKLINYLQKETIKGTKPISLIYPEKNFSYKTDIESYIQNLKDAGLKLKKWVEDFIDEDTGEVVCIERHGFLPLHIVEVNT